MNRNTELDLTTLILYAAIAYFAYNFLWKRNALEMFGRSGLNLGKANIVVQVDSKSGTFGRKEVKKIRIGFEDKRPHTLNINEIQAWDFTGKNVALQKNNPLVTTKLGNQYDNPATFGAQFLNDDVLVSTVGGKWKLPHTQNTPDTFMEVDLGKGMELDKVVIVNRNDCCQDRINGAFVYLYGEAGQIVKKEQLLGSKSSYTIDLK